jgi:acetyl esterase/lipase
MIRAAIFREKTYVVKRRRREIGSGSADRHEIVQRTSDAVTAHGRSNRRVGGLFVVIGAVLLSSAAPAAKRPARDPDRFDDGPLEASVLLGSKYRIVPNITYLTAGGWDAQLDLYLPRTAAGPVPTFLNIHGGGWVTGSKDEVALEVLPLLTMGFAVVNVNYRLAQLSPAPAAVEDCRCALRWVVRHAQQYGFDVARLVVGGMSAGGHLALMIGMAPPDAGFDRLCPGNEDLRVAAVVNFFGIVDVLDLLVGPNTRDFALGWLAQQPQPEKIARWVSPINYVRPNGPPVLTVHGDADPVVPYEHARRLARALDGAGVPNQLLTIRGGKHGDFGGDDMIKSVRVVRQFLARHRILPSATPGR